MSNAIEVKDLYFSYGNEPILSKVAFSVHQGDFVSIIGANGAGKSTLLRLLLGELLPTAGDIRLFGQDVRRFKKWSKIGYVPQNGLSGGGDFPATAEEIVKANLFSQIGLFRFPKKVHRERTQQALELVDMGIYSKRLIGNLSGGQQQRVMLARVLVSDPEIMILDEPTTGVDAQSVQSLYELLFRLNHETGLTIVMVTHDVSRSADYVSRVLCLEEGSLVELDKVQVHDELSHKHKHPIGDEMKSQEGTDSHGNSAI
ncbi:MAG: transporter related [Oscillospiraceae bacterium]|jgi:zinc transport system ATP-binding protein|nr:transporter related [Oscillospiraceae bacterium]